MKMIDQEEKQAIINEAVEQALLRLPEVVGNLITSHISSIKINKQFYDKFPEFKDSKDLVAKVIEKLENDNPGIDYVKLLDLAAPLIKEQIKTIGPLSMKTVLKPNRDMSKVFSSNNGEL
jgi:hypothetical protein